MCFSAAASFGAGAVLLPAGGFCVARAVRQAPRLLPLALTPLAFAGQQAAEGFVWLGLRSGDTALATRAGAVFLFFALAFWPFWLQFGLLLPESRRPARAFLAVLTVLSLVWLWLFAPVALEPGRWMAVEVVHHSISYGLSDLPAFQFVPRLVWRIVYLGFIVAPLLVARPDVTVAGGGLLRVLGGVVIVAVFAVSALAYWYAFTSVWCFFAALASLLLVFFFAGLAVEETSPEEERPGQRRAETTAVLR
jgi:hypothetical protein